MPAKKPLILRTVALVTLAASSTAYGHLEHGHVALPGEPCRVEADTSWTEVERWVWDRLCVGEIADLGERDGRELVPSDSTGWDEKRLLTPNFLESILLHEPWAPALPRQGVRIIGAYFKERVDLDDGQIERQLWLDESRILPSVALDRLRTRSLLSLEGTYTDSVMLDGAEIGDDVVMSHAVFGIVDLVRTRISGHLHMQSVYIDTLDLTTADIEGDLYMSDAEFRKQILVGIRVGDQMSMINAIADSLDMNTADIGGDLLINETTFTSLDLTGAKVGGQVNLDSAKVTGEFNAGAVEIGGELFMTDGTFADVVLVGAQVGKLNMTNVKITGNLDMDEAEIGGSLFMRESTFVGEINGVFIRIGQNVDLRGAKLGTLDLTGAQIKGELRMASPVREPTWNDTTGRLILRNTVVNALQENENAWPDDIDLDGFVYQRLGGLGREGSVVARGSQWYVDWLAKDKPYTPQPYEQLAGVLHRMGHWSEANEILYVSKELARGLALKGGDYWNWSGQTLLCTRSGMESANATFAHSSGLARWCSLDGDGCA